MINTPKTFTTAEKAALLRENLSHATADIREKLEHLAENPPTALKMIPDGGKIPAALVAALDSVENYAQATTALVEELAQAQAVDRLSIAWLKDRNAVLTDRVEELGYQPQKAANDG